MIEEEHLIGEELVNYFTNIFTSVQPTDFEPILQGIEKKVTPSMNSNLTWEFTADEVEQALKQMKPLLAPDRMVCHQFFINLVGILLGRRLLQLLSLS